ncbi:hypothetical protein SAMN05444392_10154 [Seinonella peptonophila]|uniref:Uncharacterized protein n=1 Tax=Seinonella peptonophila TaxID=112248 RepID=A0A1M4SN00_9BACL|nr:hypothetical protein SAMN05444392_10154 [Seinonella peptonophila]
MIEQVLFCFIFHEDMEIYINMEFHIYRLYDMVLNRYRLFRIRTPED